jgi:WXG100 family type VII secretion target
VSFSYSVDLDLARDVIGSLASVEGQLSEVVADLHWRISHLHAIWSGTAAGAHLEAHRGWEASYAEMHDALAAMRRVVHAASENYGAAGADNASMWSQVR